ncbi:MAG: amidohydrolase family protein [bacterium]|nr:amidohydrolase family protein [bacterium]
MKFDLIIKNARLINFNFEVHCIGIKDGLISYIGHDNQLSKHSKNFIDAGNNIVSLPFVNPQLHLCKVYTFDLAGEKALKSYTSDNMKNSIDGIFNASHIKNDYSEEQIFKNICKALNKAIEYGNLYIRAFIDTDTKAELNGIKAALKAKKLYSDKIEIQIVAFPQDGILRDPGAEKFLLKAMDLGADIVGGIPWIENTPNNAHEHINRIFNIANLYNIEVAMLIDDTSNPSSKTLEMLANETIKRKWHKRVSAHHVRALSFYSNNYYEKVKNLVKKAGISIVSNPHTGPVHTNIKDLYLSGINTALAQDDIVDAYYPFGRNNMLEVAFITAHMTSMLNKNDLSILYEMITKKAAKAMNISNYKIKIGNKADLLILNHDNLRDIFIYHNEPAYNIKSGKIIHSFSK